MANERGGVRANCVEGLQHPRRQACEPYEKVHRRIGVEETKSHEVQSERCLLVVPPAPTGHRTSTAVTGRFDEVEPTWHAAFVPRGSPRNPTHQLIFDRRVTPRRHARPRWCQTHQAQCVRCSSPSGVGGSSRIQAR